MVFRKIPIAGGIFTNNENLKTCFAFSIIILFLGVSVAPITQAIFTEKTNHTITNGYTFYVGGSGEGNYTMIQDAVDNAINGDTVFVFDDSSPYYESVKVNKSINLIGENRQTTVIDSNGSGEPFFILPNTNFVNISGFTIINSEFAGIDVRSSFNSFFDNIITKNEHGGIVLYELSQNNTINGNIILSNNVSGMVILYSNNNTITGNIISSNSNNGIYLSGSRSNSIKSNNISLNNWEGIMLFNSSSNTISGNIISSNIGSGIIDIMGNKNRIVGNIIHSNSNNGIEHQLFSQNSTIMDNQIYSNNGSGICIDIGFFAENNTISKNNISSNNRAGISFKALEKSTITNNIISNNEYGILLTRISYNNTISANTISNNYHGIYLNDFSTNNTIIGNTIINNEYGVEIYHSQQVNNILKNNFLGNKHHAYFENGKNKWKNNYWNRPRLLPKPILGALRINLPWPFQDIVIKWLNFDLRPALKPYDL